MEILNIFPYQVFLLLDGRIDGEHIKFGVVFSQMLFIGIDVCDDFCHIILAGCRRKEIIPLFFIQIMDKARTRFSLGLCITRNIFLFRFLVKIFRKGETASGVASFYLCRFMYPCKHPLFFNLFSNGIDTHIEIRFANGIFSLIEHLALFFLTEFI